MTDSTPDGGASHHDLQVPLEDLEFRRTTSSERGHRRSRLRPEHWNGQQLEALKGDTAAVEEALDRLPQEEYRRAIRLRLLEGRSTAELAAMMNRSEASVEILISRALYGLQKVMSRRD